MFKRIEAEQKRDEDSLNSADEMMHISPLLVPVKGEAKGGGCGGKQAFEISEKHLANLEQNLAYVVTVISQSDQHNDHIHTTSTDQNEGYVIDQEILSNAPVKQENANDQHLGNLENLALFELSITSQAPAKAEKAYIFDPELKTSNMHVVNELKYTQNAPAKHANHEKVEDIDAIETKIQAPPSSSSPTTNSKGIFAIVVSSIMAICMTFAYLQVGLRAFCPDHKQHASSIVMERVSQCPLPMGQANDNGTFVPFWKKQEGQEEELFAPASAAKGIRQVLCRGTFNVLQLFQLPNVHSKRPMPVQVQENDHSPCLTPASTDPKAELEKDPVWRAVSRILGILKKKEQTAPLLFPNELVGLDGVYDSKDFRNELKITPPYWDDAKKKQHGNANEAGAKPHFGPCYLPSSKTNWKDLMHQNQYIESEQDIEYRDLNVDDDDDLSGLCRPGFIVIGAAKCATSSLYHYLTGHPRVLPAKNKQVTYFRNYTEYPMKWYLSNFPPAETFLSNGALMTGEASPGYLPYPEVAHRLTNWMETRAGNGEGQPGGSPKIITIVRSPLERSWSSYKYNYQKPLIADLRKKDELENKHFSDEYYKNEYVFEFEDMVAAELKQLKKCLTPGGPGEQGARHLYETTDWAQAAFKRTEAEGRPPLVTLDISCYGGEVSKDVPRRQWQDLVERYPNKVINVQNLHTVQSLVGRSLYTLPVEWWYALYRKEDLYLFCNEDLRHRTADSMSDVSDFLGLPSFDFNDVVNAGLYNVGDHTGYNTITTWNSTSTAPSSDGIPISDELRKEYMDFVKPYNERLFELAGKRCNW